MFLIHICVLWIQKQHVTSAVPHVTSLPGRVAFSLACLGTEATQQGFLKVKFKPLTLCTRVVSFVSLLLTNTRYTKNTPVSNQIAFSFVIKTKHLPPSLASLSDLPQCLSYCEDPHEFRKSVECPDHVSDNHIGKWNSPALSTFAGLSG